MGESTSARYGSSFGKYFCIRRFTEWQQEDNYNVARFLVYHLVVFAFYDGRADRGLFNVEEAELF